MEGNQKSRKGNADLKRKKGGAILDKTKRRIARKSERGLKKSNWSLVTEWGGVTLLVTIIVFRYFETHDERKSPEKGGREGTEALPPEG